MLRTGFLGAGNMAFAIAGAVSDKIEDALIIPWDISADRVELFQQSFSRVETVSSPEELMDACDVLFLAVKPQKMDEALRPVKEYTGLAVSIAAGLNIAYFEERLPAARIIRVMPNTPCLVGEAASAYAGGGSATRSDLDLAWKLLSAAGKAVEVDEALMDAVTGISGSGPAFFARIAEAFIDAGIASGLEPKLARELALQTMKGTAVLMQERNMTPGELVSMVSSPGGTTVAGRSVLESSDFRKIIAATVEKTIERSRELGQ